MATLVSSWCKNVQSLPKNYIFPPDERPGKHIVPSAGKDNNHVIDLNVATDHNRAEQIQKIMKASQEHGFFQVIDHGVSESLMDEAMGVFEEFFNMPAEDKAIYYSVDPNKSCKLYTSGYNYANEKVHYWRDTLTHSYASATQDCINFWPEKPTRYREVVGAYTKEVKELVFKILDMICEGLGLQRGYFEDELSKINLLSVNYYPRCPDPSLTLGMHRHCDPNLITILQQGNVCGLQVFIDGEWISVEPLPNAFVVIIGCQLQIISNEKIKSAEHRVVTNSKEARATIGTFIIPSYDCSVEPAKALVEGTNPPLYRDFKYKDFLSTYAAKNGEFEAILESYKLQA